MFKLVLASVLFAYATAQGFHGDPKTAAIISEQRYLSGDGKFGAAYTQEDGTDFKEETDADGTRRGSYSYVDPHGQKRTISYTAGKHGFVAAGSDIPVAPPAPPHAAQSAPSGPAPAQYNAPRNYGNEDFDFTGQYDPRYNDPNFQPNKQHYSAPAPPQPQPQYNQQYQQAPAHYQPAPQPPRPAHNYQPQSYQPPQNHYTTEHPHRFQPPGKLSLNRTPDGFSYQFNKS